MIPVALIAIAMLGHHRCDTVPRWTLAVASMKPVNKQMVARSTIWNHARNEAWKSNEAPPTRPTIAGSQRAGRARSLKR